jgi:hypothetical protein
MSEAPSRRDVLRGLAGAGLGLGMLHVPAVVDAKKKRKRKDKNRKRKPKAKPNQYGCLEVGTPCKSTEQCCSGVCEGKKGKTRCRAHGTGTCDQEMPGLCSEPAVLAVCNGSDQCACLRSTANSNFCAQIGQVRCIACRKDADCVAQGMPPGSACLPIVGRFCMGECPETGMVCMTPCGTMMPTPEDES